MNRSVIKWQEINIIMPEESESENYKLFSADQMLQNILLMINLITN